MLWDAGEPIIEGSATYDPEGSITITGDCAITLNVYLD